MPRYVPDVNSSPTDGEAASSADATSWASEDLPLLGETFAVELANSHYRSAREDIDFLTDVGIRTWFQHAPAAADIPIPTDLASAAVAAVRRTRDATRLLLEESADGVRTARAGESVATLRSAAARAPARLVVELSDGLCGPVTWRLHHEGRAADVFVAVVASRCILFLGTEQARRVRRCARPACPMLFVQHHRARRFCHESCAHTERQARYYRSRSAAGRKAAPGSLSRAGAERGR